MSQAVPGSSDFPITTGAFQTTSGRGAFVTKLNPVGSALVYSTYLGGSDGAYGAGIAIDASGNAYITGSTQSSDFPTTAGAFQNPVEPGFFLVCDEAERSRVGTCLFHSFDFGGVWLSPWITLGNAYITGQTISPSLPTTPGAFQTTFGGGGSLFGGCVVMGFVSKLNASGSALVYSTYLAGTGTTALRA